MYAVAADPSDGRLYAGTRPARVFVADVDSGVPTDEGAWRVAGSVPTSGRVRGLYLPLTWDDG